MAAILPFLERPDDPSETEVNEVEFDLPPSLSAKGGTVEEPRTLRAVRSLRVLGALDEANTAEVGEVTADVLAKNHAELVNTSWVRKNVTDLLEKRTYSVVREGRHVYLELDATIVHGDGGGQETVLAWNPPASPTAKRFKALSWTSKMAAPSFSLPAGATAMGGSCPGANGGQSVVPEDVLVKGAALVKRVTGQGVRLQQTICGVCYATGGQYATSQVQFAQVLRFAWTKDCAKDVTRDGSTGRYRLGRRAELWVSIMVQAIDAANYYLDGRVKIKKPKGEDGVEEASVVSGETKGEPTITLLPEQHPGRYFRIHDSGDFFSNAYLFMWKQVADRLPRVRFWAPTRIWATPDGIDAVNEINGDAEDSNLIIRPSAYHLNEAPPSRARLLELSKSKRVNGWSAGSVSVKDTLKAKAEQQGVFDWDCRTYAIADKKLSAKHTCRHAEAPKADGVTPSGKLGCRACWLHPTLVINYTTH